MIDPIQPCACFQIKVVVNQRRNLLNVIIRKDYLTMVHYKTKPTDNGSVTYCFFLSDKVEPFVIITCVDHTKGKLDRITHKQYTELCEAIVEFKGRFGITNEGYHYTVLTERAETDKFVNTGGTRSANKSHSSHFHLKMRIATGMLVQRLPIHGLLDVDVMRRSVEPVKYNYSRETIPWAEVKTLMEADCVG
eukprot:m.113039 g.113039  ORF g.113039 m.113039 type:complete len:192 (+) comp28238_c0_seq1:54-629(+)